MSKVKVLELFAGIGACSKALERLHIPFEIVDAVEIDKYAIKSFNAIHGTDFEPQDICEWNKDIKVDLIMHGSPCQDFSIAGLGAGGDVGSGTRSSLLYESIRIIEKLQPKYVIWENVKNLLSKKHIYNWEQYCVKMNKLGYNNWCKVMNAKYYGVPQNRERVFTVSIRKDISEKEFVFPDPISLNKKLKDILEKDVDEKYYLSDERLDKIMIWQERQIKNGSGFRFYVYTEDDIARTITTLSNRPSSTTYVKVVTANKTGYMKGYVGDSIDYQYPSSKTRRGRIKHEIAHTITTSSINGVIGNDYRIRRLTPKECWRLMGFDDSDYEKASKVCSETQLYKQAGNSIVVNVLQPILKELLK